MNEPFGITITVDQAAYERLQEAQKQQLQTDLKNAIQSVHSKYATLSLNIPNSQPSTLHEMSHR